MSGNDNRYDLFDTNPIYACVDTFHRTPPVGHLIKLRSESVSIKSPLGLHIGSRDDLNTEYIHDYPNYFNVGCPRPRLNNFYKLFDPRFVINTADLPSLYAEILFHDHMMKSEADMRGVTITPVITTPNLDFHSIAFECGFESTGFFRAALTAFDEIVVNQHGDHEFMADQIHINATVPEFPDSPYVKAVFKYGIRQCIVPIIHQGKSRFHEIKYVADVTVEAWEYYIPTGQSQRDCKMVLSADIQFKYTFDLNWRFDRYVKEPECIDLTDSDSSDPIEVHPVVLPERKVVDLTASPRNEDFMPFMWQLPLTETVPLYERVSPYFSEKWKLPAENKKHPWLRKRSAQRAKKILDKLRQRQPKLYENK